MHAAYIRNRSPTKALDGLTPIEAWTGKKPDVSHFREFGCDVWVLIQGEKGSKLAPKSEKMVFVGFSEAQKAVRYHDPAKRSVRISRNYVFNENETINAESDLPGAQPKGAKDYVQGTGPDRPQEGPGPNPDGAKPAISAPEADKGKEHEETAYPPRRSARAIDRDYRQLNNPQARPTTREVQAPPDVSRPTESSAAKQKEKVSAETHIAYAYAKRCKYWCQLCR
jgi:hypothetical protein